MATADHAVWKSRLDSSDERSVTPEIVPRFADSSFSFDLFVGEYRFCRWEARLIFFQSFSSLSAMGGKSEKILFFGDRKVDKLGRNKQSAVRFAD